jgi:hypothetical protein
MGAHYQIAFPEGESRKLRLKLEHHTSKYAASPAVCRYCVAIDGVPGAPTPVNAGLVRVHPLPYVGIPITTFEAGIPL